MSLFRNVYSAVDIQLIQVNVNWLNVTHPPSIATLDTIPLREQVNKEEIQQLQDAANYQNGNNAEEIEDNTQNYIDNQQQTQTNLQSIVKRRGVVVQPDPNESEENVARRNAVKEVRYNAHSFFS